MIVSGGSLRSLSVWLNVEICWDVRSGFEAELRKCWDIPRRSEFGWLMIFSASSAVHSGGHPKRWSPVSTLRWRWAIRF